MARVFILMIVAIIVGVMVVLIAQANWVKVQMDSERVFLSSYLGEETAEIVEYRTESFFNKWFIETGAVENTYSFLLFNRSALRTVLKQMAPGVLRWIQERVEAFWWLVYQLVFRTFVAIFWLPYLLPLIAAGIIDGLMQRKIKKADHDYANTVHYHLAWNIITVLLVIPILYFSFPISIHPMAIPVWCIALTAAVAMLSSSLQHRL